MAIGSTEQLTTAFAYDPSPFLCEALGHLPRANVFRVAPDDQAFVLIRVNRRVQRAGCRSWCRLRCVSGRRCGGGGAGGGRRIRLAIVEMTLFNDPSDHITAKVTSIVGTVGPDEGIA
jgi:hypothetical protein